MRQHSVIISQTITFVKEQLQNAEAGHDWWHILRVWNNAKQIEKSEHGDHLIVALGALLHDIADSKFHDGNETVGPQLATEFLTSLSIQQNIIDEVIYIIQHISFKNSFKGEPFTLTPELAIVMDADRLDAIGAIGIARTFHYGGFKNREIYNPEIAPVNYDSTEAYQKSDAPTLNHFYEKLLKIKALMHTETGKKMADERHAFMEHYLKQFYKEWNGQL